MIEINYSDIVTPELMEGAYLHDAHTGFLQDYSVLNCLLRIYKPKTIFEVGTNIGSGINVMATALPEAKIYSLDLDYETMIGNSKQYPLEANGADRVGSAAKFPYTQLRGDSLDFNYSDYPCEAAFIDGEHDALHAEHETKAMLKNKTNLIIFHDADMGEVMAGIIAGITASESDCYEFYRVTGTRIAFLEKVKNEVTVKSESFEVLDILRYVPVKSFIEGGMVSGPHDVYHIDAPEQIIPLERLEKILGKPKKWRKKK